MSPAGPQTDGYAVAVEELLDLVPFFQQEEDLLQSVIGRLRRDYDKVGRATAATPFLTIEASEHIAEDELSAEHAMDVARRALDALLAHLDTDIRDLEETARTYRVAEQQALGHVTNGVPLPPDGSLPSVVPVVYYPDDPQQNYESIATYLVAHGYSKAAAAGIAACVAGESGGDPDQLQIGGGGGGGLIQWTPYQASHVPITGNRQRDFNAQLPLILKYNSGQGAASIQQLNSISDPAEAAKFYSENFERPAVKDSDVRAGVAASVYKFLNQ